MWDALLFRALEGRDVTSDLNVEKNDIIFLSINSGLIFLL